MHLYYDGVVTVLTRTDQNDDLIILSGKKLFDIDENIENDSIYRILNYPIMLKMSTCIANKIDIECDKVTSEDVYKEFLLKFGKEIDSIIVLSAFYALKDRLYKKRFMLKSEISTFMIHRKHDINIYFIIKDKHIFDGNLKLFFPRVIPLKNIDDVSLYSFIKLIYMIDRRIVENMTYLTEYDSLCGDVTEIVLM